MWSGQRTPGKSTTFGSGNTGMTVGNSIDYLDRTSPARRKRGVGPRAGAGRPPPPHAPRGRALALTRLAVAFSDRQFTAHIRSTTTASAHGTLSVADPLRRTYGLHRISSSRSSAGSRGSSGIMWIGLLYFFNFVNGPFEATMTATPRRKSSPNCGPGRSSGSAGGRGHLGNRRSAVAGRLLPRRRAVRPDGRWGIGAVLMIALTFVAR